MSKLLVIEATGCWEYQGCIFKGYGKFQYERRAWPAHRFMYMLHYNIILDEFDAICHKCDNRKCCNPEHLFLGTASINSKDRHTKGRTVCGSDIGTSVLTEENVLQIKKLYANNNITYKQLAEQFNIAKSTVASIILGVRWKHVILPA